MDDEGSSLFVKVCGITSESDGLLAVALGYDAVGFVFAPSPRQISPQLAGDIVKRLPPEIITVGVFRDESPSRVAEIVNRYGLSAAQLHGQESTKDCQWIAERVKLCIKAFPVGHPGISNFSSYGASLVMIDSPSPGSGKVFDWQLAIGAVDPRKMIISGGLNVSNVADAIETLTPFGVDVSSGVEAREGEKDPTKLKQFITQARAAAAALSKRKTDSSSSATALYDWEEEQ